MDASGLSAHVTDPARLAALRAVALLDTPAERSFDRLTSLAARFVNTPVALLTLVDADRQFFKSSVGLPEPWCSLRETPLSHSFCQHNRIAGRPLLVEDARKHPLLKDNLAIRDLDVIAYLGIPLATPEGLVLGSFCVIDSQPRQWSAFEVSTLEDLAAAVTDEIQLRTEVAARRRAEGERDELAELNARLREENSARRRAEQQQRKLETELFQARKMEAIGRLAGGLAHDLNNLLSPILVYGELMSEDPETGGDQALYTNEILRAGLRARDLVSQLLAFGRKQTLELKIFDINARIASFEQLLRRTIPEDIELELDLAPRVLPVRADVGQIEQIVMNLVVNAADAMPEGGRLTIATALVELDGEVEGMQTEGALGRYVKLAVSDTGCGIGSESLEYVFEPFFTTKGEMGTGLGLSTVFGIVQQHGGQIRLSSEPGEGAVFEIYLPVCEEAPAEQKELEKAPFDASGSETVLLAEDDEQVRRLAKAVLERHGFTVLPAEDGAEALESLASHGGEVDLLLTDVVMPGLNGRELYDRAVRARPGLKVLYMSGYTDEILAARGVDSEVPFLQKPFSADDLVRKIRQVLGPRLEEKRS